MGPIPTVTVEQHRSAGTARNNRARNDRNHLAGLPLRVTAFLIAHGMATLTLLLGLMIWSDWRSPEQAVSPWLILALALLLCLNPFAALAIGAMLASPDEVLGTARCLATRSMMRGHRNAIILFALGISSAALLASAALILLLRLT